MRSTLTIRDDLLQEAQRLTGLRTKREVVEAALEEVVRRHRLDRLRALLGKGFALTQEDLERMRADD